MTSQGQYSRNYIRTSRNAVRYQKHFPTSDVFFLAVIIKLEVRKLYLLSLEHFFLIHQNDYLKTMLFINSYVALSSNH